MSEAELVHGMLPELKREFGVSPSPWQLYLAALGTHVPLGGFKRAGFKRRTQFYLWNCKIHGPVYDYRRGYMGKLECPRCREEAKK